MSPIFVDEGTEAQEVHLPQLGFQPRLTVSEAQVGTKLWQIRAIAIPSWAP